MKDSARIGFLGFICICICLFPSDTQASDYFDIQLVSITQDGNIPTGNSHAPAISADGINIVFLSYASDLVATDNDDLLDVFVYDFLKGSTTLVSHTIGLSDGEPSRPSISANGKFIVYSSEASNVIPNDNNESSDVFLYDLVSDKTELISISSDSNSDGEIGDKKSLTKRPSVTQDGRYVVFYSYSTNFDSRVESTNETYQVYLRDRKEETTELISKNVYGEVGNGSSEYPTISADGSVIAFHSTATNLDLDGIDNNDTSDIFLFDIKSETIKRISNTPEGNAGNGVSDLAALSADGSKVAFVSLSDNLLLPPIADSNGTTDIYIFTEASGSIQRVSIDSQGNESNGVSDAPSLSETGRYIAFYSLANNLVVNDTNESSDVFRHDTYTSETIRVSVNLTGEEGDARSECSGISHDGQIIVFYSYAKNLIDGILNSNTYSNIYAYSLRPIVRRYYFPLLYQNAPQP